MPPDSCLISVIMPAFNAEPYIAEAVESVLAQKIEGLELIVVEDGSSDQTRSILDRFSTVPGVRILAHPESSNRGTCASRRLALGQARGEFVAFLDADDRYLPEKLPRHVELLKKNSEVVLVHGPVGVAGGSPEDGAELEKWFNLGRVQHTYDLTATAGFMEINRICNSTVVCRRAAISAGDLPPSMAFQFEDWLLWSLMSARGSFRYDPGALSVYRYHPGSFTYRQKQNPALWRCAHIEYLAILAGRLPGAPARKRAGRILAAEILSLAQAGNNCAGSKAQTRSSRQLLAAIFRPAAAEWLRLRLRSSLGGRALRYLAGSNPARRPAAGARESIGTPPK